MTHVLKILVGTSMLCFTACELQFDDPEPSTNKESPEKTKLVTSTDIYKGWSSGDEKSWERGAKWVEHGVLTESSRKKLLEIAKGSDEENAKKAGSALVQNAESIKKEYESLSGEDDSNPAKKSAKARLQAAAADVLTVAQSGTQQKKEASEWLATVLFSDDTDEQKIVHNLVKDNKDLSPELQQALADKVSKHSDHVEASQTASLLGEQTDLTDEALKGLILAGGKPGSPGQAGAVGKLQEPTLWDRIRNDYTTFAGTIQTALRSLKGDTALDSVHRVLMLQLATVGKTFADSIPILQEISTSTQTRVLKDVALELVRHASTENGGNWIEVGKPEYRDLGDVANAVAGGLGSLTGPAENTEIEKITKLALHSQNPTVAKALLADVRARSNTVYGVGVDVNNQYKLAALVLTIPTGELQPYYSHLHYWDASIVAALSKFGGGGAPIPIVGAPVGLTRAATAKLVWNSLNQILLQQVWNEDNARAALVAEANGFDSVANIVALQSVSTYAGPANTGDNTKKAKQDSLVDLLLALPGRVQTTYHGELHKMGNSIAGSLGRLHAAVNLADLTRRTSIATLVWDSNNAALAGAVLSDDNARVAFGTAAPAPGGNDVAALGQRLLAEVKRLFGNMRTQAYPGPNPVASSAPIPMVRNAAMRDIKNYYPYLHLQPPALPAPLHSVETNVAEAVREKLAIAVTFTVTAFVPPIVFTSDQNWFNNMITAITEAANATLIAYLKLNPNRAEVTDLNARVSHTRETALTNTVEWAWDAIDNL